MNELALWQRFASYCRSCAISGEHDPLDFEAFSKLPANSSDLLLPTRVVGDGSDDGSIPCVFRVIDPNGRTYCTCDDGDTASYISFAINRMPRIPVSEPSI